MTTDTYTPWQLARLADCAEPDTMDSPGSGFLARVADAVREAIAYGIDDPSDAAHDIADNAVPVYTHDLWAIFVDLGAYNEDPTELGADASDMDRAARVALYMIGERLAIALLSDATDDGEE